LCLTAKLSIGQGKTAQKRAAKETELNKIILPEDEEPKPKK